MYDDDADADADADAEDAEGDPPPPPPPRSLSGLLEDFLDAHETWTMHESTSSELDAWLLLSDADRRRRQRRRRRRRRRAARGGECDVHPMELVRYLMARDEDDDEDDDERKKEEEEVEEGEVVGFGGDYEDGGTMKGGK